MIRGTVGAFLAALLLSGCEPAPVPDEPREATVLHAPLLVATAQGDRLVMLTEQSLRRTEKRNRPNGRMMSDGSVTFSVVRNELWALDPDTLTVAWRRPIREYRPGADAVAPRIVGHDPRTLWWRGGGQGEVSTADGQARVDAGPPPAGSEAADAVNAPWYFHLGAAGGEGGPLRLPGSDVPLRAVDPAGHFQLHVSPVHVASGQPLRVERIADAGSRSLWTAALPVARLHALSATGRTLVFFGMADAGKEPGTDHPAQGSHVLVAVDIATGRVTTLDVGKASRTDWPLVPMRRLTPVKPVRAPKD